MCMSASLTERVHLVRNLTISIKARDRTQSHFLANNGKTQSLFLALVAAGYLEGPHPQCHSGLGFSNVSGAFASFAWVGAPWSII